MSSECSAVIKAPAHRGGRLSLARFDAIALSGALLKIDLGHQILGDRVRISSPLPVLAVPAHEEGRQVVLRIVGKDLDGETAGLADPLGY